MSVSLSLSSEDDEVMHVTEQLDLLRATEGQLYPPVTYKLLSRSSAPLPVILSQGGLIRQNEKKAQADTGDVCEVTWPVRPKYRPFRKPILPFDELRTERRIAMSNLMSKPNKILMGKYLICQTISPATQDPSMHIAAIEVAVISPGGCCAMRLTLYNFCVLEKPLMEIKFDEILPPGIFLILKNPWFKSTADGPLALHCDNPAEVEFISLKKIDDCISNFNWNKANKMLTFQHYKRSHLWNIPDSIAHEGEDEEVTYTRLKNLGNNALADKRFSDAIRFFDLTLEYCTERFDHQSITLSNKSLALLNIGCFNAALICAEDALEIRPENENIICRKARALIGNRKYEEALAYLEEQFEHFQSLSKISQKMIDTAKFLCSRKDLGPTESQLISICTKTLKSFDNILEFFGPLTVSQIAGKGRGYIATEDIRPGQLLICAKAFAYHQKPQSPLSSYYIRRQATYIRPCHDQIVTKIANKLLFDPELGATLYNLSGGTELKYLGGGDWKNEHIDMQRIDAIVKINAFGTSEKIGDEMKDYTGLWLPPSLLNHSCSEFNCIYNVCGEVMIVRALGEIKKGTELMITYINPTVKYAERRQMGNSRDFTCSCKLCELDANETYVVKNERMEILQDLAILNSDSSQGDLKKAVKQVEKLYTMRKENVGLNFYLLSDEVLGIGYSLFKKRYFDDCISVLMRAFEVANNSVLMHERGIKVAVRLINCHIAREDKNSADLWVAITKEALMKFYGSLEPFRQLGKRLIPKLKEAFGIDFFLD